MGRATVRGSLESLGIITVAAALALAPVVAHANPPQAHTFTHHETYVDDGASAACGFPVTVDITTEGRFTTYFDSAGNPTRFVRHEDDSGTASANGVVLRLSGHNTQFMDAPTGVFTEVGVVFREDLPGTGVAIMDRGRIVFDADGNLTFEAGPHPALDGNFGTLCAILA